jgi:hypothetical protein
MNGHTRRNWQRQLILEICATCAEEKKDAGCAEQ